MKNFELDETFLPMGAGLPQHSSVDSIRLAGFQDRSFVAGPGERAVIWVAGCRRRCPGCFKPEWFSFDVGEAVGVDELAARVFAIDGIDGVTLSGGEPFEQADPLARLCRLIRREGLSVLTYSGYRLETLRKAAGPVGVLLTEIDILIDGEFRHDMQGDYKWRGSSNQKIHFLTAVAREHSECDSMTVETPELQVTVSGNDGIRLTGFPTLSVQRELASALKRRGVHLRETE